MSDWHKIEWMVNERKKFFITFPSFNFCKDKVFTVIYNGRAYPLASIVGTFHPRTYDLVIGEVVQVSTNYIGIRFIFPSIPAFAKDNSEGIVQLRRSDVVCKFIRVSEKHVVRNQKTN
jgi:hypothetical protein